jgi:HPr kinase/phosphorylase
VDDMVEFSARDDNRLWGRSPGLLKNYLGIRDLGVLNITQLFGPQSILEEKELSLVIQLEKSVTSPHEISFNDKPWVLQGVTVPSFCLSLSEGRPRDLLLEMCVRNYQLIQKGHQPNQDFLENHHKKMSIPA